jgi:hypothetical protein
VQTRDLNFSRIDRFKNPRQQADSNSMAKFSEVKAEIADFAKHRSTVGVAVGIPTRGEGVHGELKGRVRERPHPA